VQHQSPTACFKNNAHEMMVHMLMSCSYDAQMQGKHLGCYRPNMAGLAWLHYVVH
jgi:hypothetical protein